MGNYIESSKIEGICRYDEAGNPIRLDKGFEKEDTRKKRSFLPLKHLIKKDLSMNNKYRKKRGVRIAPNISNSESKEKEVEL